MSFSKGSLPLVIGLALLVAGPPTALAVVHPADINPTNFNQPIQNPYFPLVAGTFYVYVGTKEGVSTRDEVCVTGQTKLIQGVGVLATVVHHKSFEGGLLVEDTQDWFAPDNFGTVWYMGEDTTEFPSGSKEGSWEAGVDDADAGFIMLADPQVGDRYYQEFARNVAEDQAKVLSLDETVTLTVNGSSVTHQNVLLTQEKSRFDPGVVEYKYYAQGVGFIRGVFVKGGDEHTELISIGTCFE
jgi:hypothetical protein